MITKNYKKFFLERQEKIYNRALQQLEQGYIDTCIACFIFPYLRNLATNRKNFVFGIIDVEDAENYLAHPVLSARLIECCEMLLKHKNKDIKDMFNEIDVKRLQLSMTLFALVSRGDSIFHKVLEVFYNGEKDPQTVEICKFY